MAEIILDRSLIRDRHLVAIAESLQLSHFSEVFENSTALRGQIVLREEFLEFGRWLGALARRDSVKAFETLEHLAPSLDSDTINRIVDHYCNIDGGEQRWTGSHPAGFTPRTT